MKPVSNRFLITAAFFLVTGGCLASASADLFMSVPSNDPTYSKLQTLESAGLLPEGSSSKPLTRYEVADLILKAQKNYDTIVVADANPAPAANAMDTTLPPMPDMTGIMASPALSASVPSTAGNVPLPDLTTPVASPGAAVAAPAMTATAAPTAEPSMTSAMPAASTDDDNYAAPPPPSESVMNSDASAAAATPPPAAPPAKPTPNYAQHPELLQSAEAALTSLDEAYEVELQAVMQAKGVMLDDLTKAEADQYQLWRDVKSLTESPNVSIYGIGRMFGISQQTYNNYSFLGPSTAVTHIGAKAVTYLAPQYVYPEVQYMNGYLDLNPVGTITKQLQWNSIIRLGTSALPLSHDSQYNNAFGAPNNVNFDTLNFRWIAMQFSPDFMTMDLGDFYESYTPLTMWNRNNLDLFYKPEPIARSDDEYKYESFFNHEPDWPFRGVRLGTSLGWPDSNVLDSIKVSAFVHMISNGFNDWPNNGWLNSANTGTLTNANTAYQTNFFTDFIYAGKADIELKKLYMGDLSFQLSAKGYLVILDELWNPYGQQVEYLNYAGNPTGNAAGAVTEYIYDPHDPNTWAHQYRITSMNPELKIGFGGDVYLGAQYEGSFSEYQDDKANGARTISDFAVYANPYFQFDGTKLTFDYLNVGPNYYSPLAQTRQDDLSVGTALTSLNSGPGLFSAPLRGQYFLIDQRLVGGANTYYTDVPRPNAIYSFYDRTQDNVFPYGLATPNRQGIGFDLDINSLPDKSFKLPGSVYFLSEIEPNVVASSGGNSTVAVDGYNGVSPVRNFVYVNLGPSFDFGPALQLKTPLELGTNIRYESTSSQVGTLQDIWWLTGVRIGLFNWWEVTAAGGLRTASGTDMGIDGTTVARYSYIYNNEDLGTYTPFTVNDAYSDILLSTTFSLDDHSKLHLDYSFEAGTNNGASYSGLAPGTTLAGYGAIITSPGNAVAGTGSLNGTVNVQYVEMSYEIKF